MARKLLTNASNLLDLIERAPVAVLRVFSGLPECEALSRGFDWSQDESTLAGALLEHIRHLRREQREPAEREALRIVRLASSRGSAILTSVADQLNDADLFATFLSQPGSEFGRAVWMRAHSDATARLFEIAESILNTADIRGNKRLYDAFDVPCDDPPPFLWNDKVKRELEAELTRAMRLAEPCEVVHVALADEQDDGEASVAHCLVVRFAGEQVTAVQVVNRNRRSFCYFPARDATLLYAPGRKVVEVYAHTLSTRAPLANVLSAHGFKVPLSSRPLNRSRYDLSRFAQPLKGAKPRLDGAKVERLYLAEAHALLGHASDAVTVHLDSGVELHDVMSELWGNHPFSQPAAILGVTLVADLVFAGKPRKRRCPLCWPSRGDAACRASATCVCGSPARSCWKRWGVKAAQPRFRHGRSGLDRAGCAAAGMRHQPDGRLCARPVGHRHRALRGRGHPYRRRPDHAEGGRAGRWHAQCGAA